MSNLRETDNLLTSIAEHSTQQETFCDQILKRTSYSFSVIDDGGRKLVPLQLSLAVSDRHRLAISKDGGEGNA